MERRQAPDRPVESAADNLGPHLLGRVEQPVDPRDKQHRMAARLKADPETYDETLMGMTLGDLLASGYLSNWKGVLAFWRWLRLRKKKPKVTRRVKLWQIGAILDQGQTGHCEGFAWTNWSNTEPVVNALQNSDGHALYYECKVIDGEPGAENGSYTRSGAKAMQNHGRLGEYVWASTVAEIVAWILNKGPVVVGTDWDGPMFKPDVNGYLHPNGQPEGGHAYVLVGYDDGDKHDFVDKEPFFWMEQSWGAWGYMNEGRAKITVREFQGLLDRDGDAAAAAELPL